jgi:hypothetical protein
MFWDVMRCSTVSQPTFRTNVLYPSLRSNSNPSRNQKEEGDMVARRITLHSSGNLVIPPISAQLWPSRNSTGKKCRESFTPDSDDRTAGDTGRKIFSCSRFFV